MDKSISRLKVDDGSVCSVVREDGLAIALRKGRGYVRLSIAGQISQEATEGTAAAYRLQDRFKQLTGVDHADM